MNNDFPDADAPDDSPQHPDLFSPAPSEQEIPSEGVYVDTGGELLEPIGEIQLPRPIPVELVVEVDGWDYTYKLSKREKSRG